MRLRVTSDIKAVQRKLEGFDRSIEKVTYQALNDTAKEVQGYTAKAIAGALPVKVSGARRAMRIYKANRRNLNASVVASGKPLPLKAFNRVKQKGSVVTANLLGKNIRVTRTWKSAAKSKLNGHYFRRTTEKRMPIKKVYGPGIEQAFNVQSTLDGQRAEAQATFLKRWNYRAERELRRLQLKGR